MRCLLVACVVATALLQSGCDAVTSAADKYNPFASFETRCARLPPAHIEVRKAAINVVTNDGLPFRELTQLGEGNPATHRTLGQTRAEFRQNADIEIAGLHDTGGARACSRPRILLTLSMTPMTVYVASELKDIPCARGAVLDSFEKQYLARLISVAEGNVSNAARIARMDRSYLIKLLQRHGLK